MIDFQRTQEVYDALTHLPRVNLVMLPTPFQELTHLSASLGDVRIFMKRDDLCDIALTGTKGRMLELRLGRAAEQKADVLIGGWAAQSNHSRQIAAAAARVGMECYLVLRHVPGVSDVPSRGNLLLDELFGARVEILSEETSAEDQERRKKQIADELRRSGRNPYITGYEDDLNALGAMLCGLEMYRQCAEEFSVIPDYLFCSSANTTHAGLLLATSWLNLPTEVIAVQHGWPCDGTANERVRKSCRQALDLLGPTYDVQLGNVKQLDEYFGARYGDLTAETSEAIALLGKLEGIILDPVYTGKAMAAVIDYIRTGKIRSGKTVAFVHTGGFPALFAYNNPLSIATRQD